VKSPRLPTEELSRYEETGKLTLGSKTFDVEFYLMQDRAGNIVGKLLNAPGLGWGKHEGQYDIIISICLASQDRL
jgi:hypothetical protein